VHLLRRDGGRAAVDAAAQTLQLLDDALRLVEANHHHDVRTAQNFTDDVRQALQRALRAPEPVGAA
jgi:hypothetical protein